MAVLESCPKHNMVAYLEKTEGNAEFHEIIDFLKRSSIHHALTVSSVVSTTFVEQFWTSAKSKILNNVRHITAKVAGKSVSISEASIRSDLLFDDADGIDSLPNQAIFDAIQLMGYEGDLTVLTFNKALFSPQWRFLFHTINHCLSSKSTSWDQIPTNIATAVICLTSNQKYNFSKLIFDGMLRHLDAKKKFVMYPRFISIFLGKQLDNVSVPLDHFPVNTLTSKVFSFMVKKGKHFSGKVTPLFATMLVQPTQDEGVSSERPSEAQPTPSPVPTSEVPYEPQTDSSPAQTSEVPIEHQPNLSPRPSPTPNIPDSIPETSGENLGGHSSSDKSLSGNEDDMTIQSVYDICLSLCKQVSDQAKEIQALKAQITKLKKQSKPVIKHHKAYLKSVSLKQRFPRKSLSKKHKVHKESVSKQGRKFAKGESSVQRDPLFDEMPEDTVDHMETDNAQDEGRTREIVDEDKEMEENVLSTEDVLSTEEQNKDTVENFEGSKEYIEGTEEKVESTDGHKKGTEEEIAAQAERNATQATQHLTLPSFRDDDTIAKAFFSNMSLSQGMFQRKEKGPLPKIDPKDKGKKKIEEEDESKSESDGIPEAEKKFKQLKSDEEMARKIQEQNGKVRMDDPYITMEEYIKLEEERAQRYAEFLAIVLGNINSIPSQSPEIPYCETIQGMTMEEYEAEKEDSEIEFSAIDLDNTLKSDTTLSYEPTVSPLNESAIDFRISFDESDDEEYTVIFDKNSFSYKIISIDYSKMDSETDNNKVNFPSSPEPTVSYSNDLDFFKEFVNEFPAIAFNDNLTSELVEPSIIPLHINELKNKTSLSKLDKDGQQLGGVRRRMTWRQFILALGLHTEQEMAHAGFGAYYMDRGTINVPYRLAQYLFRHVEGRKSGARLSGGHFIRRLADHFGLVSDEGLRGLSVISRELPVIDLHELAKLNIHGRFGDICAWVGPRPKRQPDAAVGAHGATKDAPVDDEDPQADLTPTHAPLPPPAPQP
ncbi:hypothetical protein Tco_0797885 [Tanacetum coccineum]